MRRIHLAILLVLLALVWPAVPVHAATIVTVCDEAHLRAALPDRYVTFACSGTIVLTSTINISVDTELDGSGQAVIISGNHAVRVFEVFPGHSLDLDDITVAYGSADYGAGIKNSGNLYMLHSAFWANHATYHGGAIYNTSGADLSISSTTFDSNNASGNGGAIHNHGGTVAIRASTYKNNFADYGAGMYMDGGTATVVNSTFYANSARDGGGGIANNYGDITVVNCTFSHNDASDDISTGSGASFYGDGTLRLKNTIAANRVGGRECMAEFMDYGGNLSYPDLTCPGIVANPLLGPLQDNGGRTYTMALGSGSPAIDKAVDEFCVTAPMNGKDQRGVIRPQGAHCDIGAVEQQPPSAPPPAQDMVDIDIKPGGDDNAINCRNASGLLTVAILTTDRFDATTVDQRTVDFEGATETHVAKKTGDATRHEEDVDGDGDVDLVLHFRMGNTGLTCQAREGTLAGQTFTGQLISGTDTVRMIGAAQKPRVVGRANPATR